MVRAQVSVLCCPEGTTGYVKAIMPARSGPAILIDTSTAGEITVSASHYRFFFDECQAAKLNDAIGGNN